MKKLLIPICILFSFSTSGQNIGIGTTIPQARLHIVNGFSGYSGGYFPGAIIEGTGSSYLNFLTPNNLESGILFGKTSDGASGGIIYNNGGSSNSLQFRTGGNNTWMTINSSGNIGIGRTDPEFPLHFASVVGEKISLFGSFGSNYGMGIANGQLFIHTDIPSSDITFGHGGWGFFNETMRVKGNGNVGIGTNSPTEKLDVTGSVKASSYKYSPSKTFFYSIPACAFQPIHTNNEVNTFWDGANFTSTNVPGYLLAPVNLPHGATVTSFTVFFQDNSPTVELEVTLSVRQHTSTGVYSPMAEIVSAAITGNTSMTDNSIAAPTIDNQTNCYFIVAKSALGLMSPSWPSTSLILRSVLITYTQSEAQ